MFPQKECEEQVKALGSLEKINNSKSEMEISSCDLHSDTNLSGRKMEEDEAELRILECLRGRLVAERAASKAAKQHERLMDSKLKELEAQLRSETKARKRFEKKLSFLKKKLHSLKIPHSLEDSEESRSSSLDNSDSSCISSIASTEEPEQEVRSTSNISSDQITEIPSYDFHTLQQCPSQETPKIDKESANSETDSPTPKLEKEDNNNEDTSKSQEDDYEVDNSMALVPLSFPEEESEDSAAKEVVKITSESVRDVLGTLKNIREEIQRTMQRRQATRQMIQVG